MLDDNNSCVSFFFLLGLKVNSWGSLSLEVQFISRSGIEVGFDVRVEIFDTYTLKFCFLPSYTILRALTLVASLTPGRLFSFCPPFSSELTISCNLTGALASNLLDIFMSFLIGCLLENTYKGLDVS